MRLSTIHFVRHGEVYNPEHVVYERLPDFYLSDRGKRMAKATAEYLAYSPQHGSISAVYCSPLDRTRQTAQIIIDEINSARTRSFPDSMQMDNVSETGMESIAENRVEDITCNGAENGVVKSSGVYATKVTANNGTQARLNCFEVSSSKHNIDRVRYQEYNNIPADVEPLVLVTDERLIEASNEFRGKRVGRGEGAIWKNGNWKLFKNLYKPSWGESYENIIQRMSDFAREKALQHVGEQIVAVSHESPIWSYRHFLETGKKYHNVFARTIALASVTSITYDCDAERVVALTYVDPAAKVI